MKRVLTIQRIKLLISVVTRSLKVRRIFRYHVSNKLLSTKNYAHDVLLLFYRFRDEEEFLSCFPPTYQNKLQEKGFQEVVNIKKIKFKSYIHVLDHAFFAISWEPD